MIGRFRPAWAGSAAGALMLAALCASRIAFAASTPAKPSAEAAVADAATIATEADTIETSAAFTWTVNLEVKNPLESGLYLDSLFCDVEDQGPGQTRAERTTRLDLTALIKLSPAIEAGGRLILQHSGPAPAEMARLRYTIHLHRSTGAPFTRSVVVIARPGASTTFESKHLEVGGKKVEYVIVPASPERDSNPAILLVHGHGNHARHTIRFARQFAPRGYIVMLVSMPGYGTSDGPADLMGPATVAALEKSLDALRGLPGVDSTRIAAWGISRGATAVAALAARRPDLDAVVLQSGIYDLWATHRGTGLDGFPATIVAEAGTDSAAWKVRSPIASASSIKTPVLILHGERDANVPVGQAKAFEARLAASGGTAESRYFPTSFHQLATGEVFRLGVDFLTRHLAR